MSSGEADTNLIEVDGVYQGVTVSEKDEKVVEQQQRSKQLRRKILSKIRDPPHSNTPTSNVSLSALLTSQVLSSTTGRVCGGLKEQGKHQFALPHLFLLVLQTQQNDPDNITSPFSFLQQLGRSSWSINLCTIQFLAFYPQRQWLENTFFVSARHTFQLGMVHCTLQHLTFCLGNYTLRAVVRPTLTRCTEGGSCIG